jgi:DNA-directed RNA polymerase specialized sigma24 family protein
MTAGDFAATRWSMVLRARGDEEPAARAAMSDLCRTYWYPLYAFARRSGRSHHEAEDLTQGLFASLIQRKSLAAADPARGRFRSFLLGAMKHHMADEHARDNALKRGGHAMLIPLDAGDGESRYAAEPADSSSPEAFYDHRWARELLQATIKELAAEYAAAGKERIFDALQGQLVGSAQEGAGSDAAVRLGVTDGHLRVLSHRLRLRFAGILRRRVADTVGAETDVDEELRHLIACVSG